MTSGLRPPYDAVVPAMAVVLLLAAVGTVLVVIGDDPEPVRPSFTDAELDTQGPQIRTVDVGSNATVGEPINVTATFALGEEPEVIEVKLYHRKTDVATDFVTLAVSEGSGRASESFTLKSDRTGRHSVMVRDVHTATVHVEEGDQA